MSVPRPMRTAFVSLTSLSVLLLGALFVALPAQTSVSFAVSDHAIQGKGSVIYGKMVDRRGDPAVGVRIAVVRWVKGDRRVLRVRETTSDGLFRVQFRNPARDRYRVRVLTRQGGDTYVGVRVIEMRPGTAYDVSAELRRFGSLVFFPISSY